MGGKIAGMRFTKRGVVLDDNAVAALELAMDEVIAKRKVNEKDARRMCGILLGYCSMHRPRNP